VPAATTTARREARAGLTAAGAIAASTVVAQADPARGQKVAPRTRVDASVADRDSTSGSPRLGVQIAMSQGLGLSHAAGRDQCPGHLPYQLPWHHILANTLHLGASAREGAGACRRRERREPSCEAPAIPGEQRCTSLTRSPPQHRRGTQRKPSGGRLTLPR
jgi:hypothetical protein